MSAVFQKGEGGKTFTGHQGLTHGRGEDDWGSNRREDKSSPTNRQRERPSPLIHVKGGATRV